MQENTSRFTREHFHSSKEEHGKVFSNILTLDSAPKHLLDAINADFRSILTKWIDYKSELTHSATYGIREYLNNSTLPNHYDKPNTHVISAIIHIDSDAPWDLYIEDHMFAPHRITMEYGDVLLYESATCLHGRPEPYEGTSYRNMYVHCMPDMW
jgi:hypothetical protein